VASASISLDGGGSQHLASASMASRLSPREPATSTGSANLRNTNTSNSIASNPHSLSGARSASPLVDRHLRQPGEMQGGSVVQQVSSMVASSSRGPTASAATLSAVGQAQQQQQQQQQLSQRDPRGPGSGTTATTRTVRMSSVPALAMNRRSASPVPGGPPINVPKLPLTLAQAPGAAELWRRGVSKDCQASPHSVAGASTSTVSMCAAQPLPSHISSVAPPSATGGGPALTPASSTRGPRSPLASHRQDAHFEVVNTARTRAGGIGVTTAPANVTTIARPPVYFENASAVDPMDKMITFHLMTVEEEARPYLKMKRLGPGLYELDSRKLSIRWPRGIPGEGPLLAREVRESDGEFSEERTLESYIRTVADVIVVMREGAATISRLPKEKRLTFSDNGTKGGTDLKSDVSNHLEALDVRVRTECMKKAVEEARLREAAAAAYEAAAAASAASAAAAKAEEPRIGHSSGSSGSVRIHFNLLSALRLAGAPPPLSNGLPGAAPCLRNSLGSLSTSGSAYGDMQRNANADEVVRSHGSVITRPAARIAVVGPPPKANGLYVDRTGSLKNLGIGSGTVAAYTGPARGPGPGP